MTRKGNCLIVLVIFFLSWSISLSYADSYQWPARIRPGAINSNRDDNVYVDYFLPITGSENDLFFFNQKLMKNNNSANEQNVGLGYRKLVWDDDLIIGANLFYDYRKSSSNNDHHQIGCGFEALSKWLDMRINTYFPITGKRKTDSVFSFSETSLLRRDSYEEPLRGLDFEVGVLVPYLSDYMETRLYGGGYCYESRIGSNVTGKKLKIEARPVQLLTLEFEVKDDTLNGTDYFVGGYFTLPFEIGNLFQGKNPFEGASKYFNFGKGPRPVRERMVDRVIRDIDIVSPEYAEDFQFIEHDVVYVDNSNAGTEDGSLSNPYDTVQEGVNNAFGDSWVYVKEGAGDYTENVTLANGVTLWGSRYNGGFKGITSDSGPTINRNGSTVIMASNSTLMGFTIKGGTTDGVRAVDKTNFTIMQNNITAADYAIQVRAVSSECLNSTISGNVISNVTGFGPVGIYVYSWRENISNFSISGNTVSNSNGFGASGIYVYNDGGSMPNFKITGNTVSTFVGAVASGNGIQISNEDSVSASDFTLTNNIVTNNSHFGIMITEAPGAAEDSTYSLSRNTVASNGIYGIGITGDAGASDRVDLGGGIMSSAGNNSFYSNVTNDLLNADGSGTVQAQNNWWGQAEGPIGSQVVGNVNTADFLTSDPN